MHRIEKNILHNANKNKEFRKYNLPHYYVKNNLFICYDEAIVFCDKNNLSYNEINKSYIY